MKLGTGTHAAGKFYVQKMFGVCTALKSLCAPLQNYRVHPPENHHAGTHVRGARILPYGQTAVTSLIRVHDSYSHSFAVGHTNMQMNTSHTGHWAHQGLLNTRTRSYLLLWAT